MLTLGPGDFLEPAQGHRVWYSAVGPRSAPAVLIVHGGPGGHSREDPLRWWPQEGVHAISLDQRGCGRSAPCGALEHNTVEALVEDMERLRRQLQQPAWGVVAGSWGAFVALHYAARHPERVRGLFLRSPFLGSCAELNHYLEPWGDWMATADAGARGSVPDPGQVYRMLQAPSQADTAFSPGHAAQALGPWIQAFEAVQSAPGGWRGSGRPAPAAPMPLSESAARAWAVHASYAQRRWTTGDDAWQVARDALRLVQGPRRVVHGVEDAVCPVETARRLRALDPTIRLVEVAGGGHRMASEPMAGALRLAASQWLSEWAPSGA